MRVLVVTVVHHPGDARILHRQIAALRAAGHDVTYAAPFSSYAVPLPGPDDATGAGGAPGAQPRAGTLDARDLPRAHGRSRVAALRAARRLLRAEAPRHDVVLLHDPELLLAATGLPAPPRGPVMVWDVHEDTAAAVTLKPWLPVALRPATAAGIRGVERLAERRVRLLLAEEGYRDRFRQSHPVVPNSTVVPATVPAPGVDRAVYVGHCSAARGALDLVEAGRRLAPHGIAVEVVGHGDAATVAALRQADAAGVLRYRGFEPNDVALARAEGALAGLSLLHDEPNYRHSRPTKVIEYMARGVPVVTTPTPPARDLVRSAGSGLIVPFEDPAAAAAAVLRLRDDPALRTACAEGGRRAAAADHDWGRDGPAFVSRLEAWARDAGRGPGGGGRGRGRGPGP